MRMRWYSRPAIGGKMRTQVSDVATAGEVALGVQNLLHHPDVTRIDIVTKDYVPDPKPRTKAQAIEWEQADHPKGEYWVGTINGKKVADVFQNRDVNTQPTYTLHLGDLTTDSWGEVASIESGKRAAQRALNKVVRALLGEV